jgi:hypothetical protein
MGKGGARVRSGPAPDPNALRRDRDASEWVRLPARCDRDVPGWPLTDQSERESELWAELWRKPQAVEWHRLGLASTVGLYVRSFAAAESPESAVAMRTLVRQLGDDLGLSLAGMRAHRWVVEGSDDDRAVGVERSVRPSARDRLRVVGG